MAHAPHLASQQQIPLPTPTPTPTPTSTPTHNTHTHPYTPQKLSPQHTHTHTHTYTHSAHVPHAASQKHVPSTSCCEPQAPEHVTSPSSSPNDAECVLQRCYKGVTKAKDDCNRSVTGACQQHVTSPNSSPNDAEEVLQRCYER
jgi:hypothetical protein